MNPEAYVVSCFPRSMSTDADIHSDFNSESEKDTVSEKYLFEVSEKEIKDRGSILEKDTSTDSINTKEKEAQRNVSRAWKTSESHKRSYDLSAVGDVAMDETPRKKRSSPTGSDVLSNSIHMPSSGALTIQELLTRVNFLRKKGLFSEYTSIRMEPPAGTFNTSKLKANISKNRYSDVLCSDHSRVVLPLVGDNHNSDYINANFVDGYKQRNAFICTQGPLPNTIVDFWRMVWHTQARVVVMTTRTIEKSRVKCGQYWPNEIKGSKKFDEFVVYHNGVTENQDFTETQLKLHNTNTGESRLINHLQFISWPDHGVPPAAPFLDFLFRVRRVQETATSEMGSSWAGHHLGPPIVVHCSAGIGRTGTFITVDICLRQLEDEGTVDVKETVRRIRSQRAYSIQMPDQYVFCHLAVITHAQRSGLLSSNKLISPEDIE